MAIDVEVEITKRKDGILIKRAGLFDNFEYKKDLDRIVNMAFTHYYELSDAEAYAIWKEYSSMHEAEWLFLPNNGIDLWQIIWSRICRGI